MEIEEFVGLLREYRAALERDLADARARIRKAGDVIVGDLSAETFVSVTVTHEVERVWAPGPRVFSSLAPDSVGIEHTRNNSPARAFPGTHADIEPDEGWVRMRWAQGVRPSPITWAPPAPEAETRLEARQRLEAAVEHPPHIDGVWEGDGWRVEAPIRWELWMVSDEAGECVAEIAARRTFARLWRDPFKRDLGSFIEDPRGWKAVWVRFDEDRNVLEEVFVS